MQWQKQTLNEKNGINITENYSTIADRKAKKFKLNGHTTGGLGAFKKFLDKFWLFGK